MTEHPEPLWQPPVIEPHEHQAVHDAEAGAAAERSAFAVHRDPSRGSGSSGWQVGRGIEWVRPSDLIATSSARVAGRGIDFQAELARQARRVPGRAMRAGRQQVRAVRDRAATRRSAVVEADGFDIEYRRPPASASLARARASGIGLR